jgi:cell wall-associated NlpC family hydrolase
MSSIYAAIEGSPYVGLKYEHLEGIPFTGLGYNDCFTLSRRFFKDNFDIDIPHCAIPNDWRSDQLDLLRILPDKCGFDLLTEWKLSDLRPADAMCIAIGESNPNHICLYLGDDMILHHLYGRFSKAEPYRDFWRDKTAFLLRHRDVPDLRPVYPDVDIRTLLDVRNAPPTG